MNRYSIGDVVKLRDYFLGEKAGTKAVVYDRDINFGVGIITENGVDLGYFSGHEQEEYLEFICKTNLKYKFINCLKLSKDFDNGYFNEVFKEIK